MVERLTGSQEVRGSNPLTSTRRTQVRRWRAPGDPRTGSPSTCGSGLASCGSGLTSYPRSPPLVAGDLGIECNFSGARVTGSALHGTAECLWGDPRAVFSPCGRGRRTPSCALPPLRTFHPGRKRGWSCPPEMSHLTSHRGPLTHSSTPANPDGSWWRRPCPDGTRRFASVPTLMAELGIVPK